VDAAQVTVTVVADVPSVAATPVGGDGGAP